MDHGNESDGANRSSSDFQFAISEAGTTSRLAASAVLRPGGSASDASSRAITWTVLPRPMSSARQAPSPRRATNRSQRSPSAGTGEAPPSSPGGRPLRASRENAALRSVDSSSGPGGQPDPLADRCFGALVAVAFVEVRPGEQAHPFEERDAAPGGPPSRPPSSAPGPRPASRDRPRPTSPSAGPGRRPTRAAAHLASVSVSPSRLTPTENSSSASTPSRPALRVDLHADPGRGGRSASTSPAPGRSARSPRRAGSP